MGAEDTDATNELINDGDSVQPLTLKEIEELKNSGIHASVSLILLCSSQSLNAICTSVGNHTKADRSAC